jgi:integrase
MPLAIKPLSKADFDKAVAPIKAKVAANPKAVNQKLAVGNGLYLHFRAGSALWVYQYRDGDAHRAASLGSFPDKSLNAARSAREARRVALRNGTTETRTERGDAQTATGETFGQVLALYLAEAGSDWGQHERTDFRNMMDKAPKLLALAVDGVNPKEIAATVQVAYPDSLKRQAKFRRRIAAVMTFAETRHVKKNLEVVHHPAMPLAELPALMTELAALDSADARALRFTILTAARSGETLGATWEEITEKDGIPCWVHDRAHRKGRGAKDVKPEDRLHYVPLTAQMIACLGSRGTGLIFRSRLTGGKLGHSVMNDLLTTLRPAVDDNGKALCSVHGMRSTFRDWITDKTNYDGDLGELALAHRVGNKSKQAYARSGALAKRLPLMQDWSDLIVR